jgi:hypothetical protein
VQTREDERGSAARAGVVGDVSRFDLVRFKRVEPVRQDSKRDTKVRTCDR